MRRFFIFMGPALLLMLAACGSDGGEPQPPPGGSVPPPPTTGPSSPGPSQPAPRGSDDGGTAAPGDDASPTPTTPTDPAPPVKITAHIDPTCDPTSFAGFVLTIGKLESTCDNRWSAADDRIQLTVGDASSAPPAATRTYTVRSQSSFALYPGDGEAAAVYLPAQASSDAVQSGTLTMVAAGTNVTGTYSLTLASGTTLSGSFTADTCAIEPGGCE